MTTKQRTFIGVAAAAIIAIDPAALAQEKPFNYNPPAAAQAPAPDRQKIEQPFEFDPGYSPPPKSKPKPKPARKMFDYDPRHISKSKLDRCMKELPWKQLLPEDSTAAKRREFCQKYQIEIWTEEDRRKVQSKLESIFGVGKR
jgi:hypothetical protein